MRMLFIHHSFPGPFRNLTAHFGATPGNTVLFLSERSRRAVRLRGVRRLLVAPVQSEDLPAADAAEKEMLTSLKRGARMANALLKLKTEGFEPDIICASSGLGASLYVRDIFPQAFYLVYADWFYTKGVNHTFFNQGRPRSPADFAQARIRNLSQLNALSECHLAVTSTHWQKEQFPPVLAEKLHVLYEGVDTDYFSPAPALAPFVTPTCDLSDVTELITFSGRSLDPFRGFPQLCQSLPQLLAKRPRCHVLIMASTNAATLPPPLATLYEAMPEARYRVHLLGFRPYEEYLALLRASTVHVYLTAPFALSAGLFEALSCGCLVLGSDTEPVREVITHGHNGFLCDFWDTAALTDTLKGLLERASLMQPVRHAARQTILEGYSRQSLVPQYLTLLREAYASYKNTSAT